MATVALAPARYPVGRRILSWGGETDGRDVGLSLELERKMLSDTVFRFLDGSPESSGASSSSDDGYKENGEMIEEDGEEEEGNADLATSIEEKKKVFWENQHKVLKEMLCTTSSVERAIRNATTEAMKEMQAVEGSDCVCVSLTPAVESGGGGCRSCLMTEISRRLRDRGYDSAICRSKWRSTVEIPAGEHTFIVVTDNSNPKKGEVRVIIELSFRAEFEMARAGEEYNQLVSQLPEAFVGKMERLRAIVKILCSAAKKCCKDKRIHIGPWRKHKYMRAKWSSSSCEKLMEAVAAAIDDDKPVLQAKAHPCDRGLTTTSKPKASMLTVALLGTDVVPGTMQPKAV